MGGFAPLETLAQDGAVYGEQRALIPYACSLYFCLAAMARRLHPTSRLPDRALTDRTHVCTAPTRGHATRHMHMHMHMHMSHVHAHV